MKNRMKLSRVEVERELAQLGTAGALHGRRVELGGASWLYGERPLLMSTFLSRGSLPSQQVHH